MKSIEINLNPISQEELGFITGFLNNNDFNFSISSLTASELNTLNNAVVLLNQITTTEFIDHDLVDLEECIIHIFKPGETFVLESIQKSYSELSEEEKDLLKNLIVLIVNKTV